MLRRGNNVLNRARQNAPVRTGTLRASLNSQLVQQPGDWGPAVRIGTTLYYALYVHEGTGVYAGRGPIRPRHGPRLVWTDWQTGDTIWARQVQGTPPNPFLRDALEAARD